jgi:hypothetical protein
LDALGQLGVEHDLGLENLGDWLKRAANGEME